MGLLEKHLHSRTFLVGHAATLADIVGVCNLYFGYTKVSKTSCNYRLVCTSVVPLEVILGNPDMLRRPQSTSK